MSEVLVTTVLLVASQVIKLLTRERRAWAYKIAGTLGTGSDEWKALVCSCYEDQLRCEAEEEVSGVVGDEGLELDPGSFGETGAGEGIAVERDRQAHEAAFLGMDLNLRNEDGSRSDFEPGGAEYGGGD